MVNTPTALKGRNVYGSGSYAPTKGRVSAAGAQGYLQRSIRNGTGVTPLGGVRRVGSDGQSDTRSGVAASANARRQAQAGKSAQNAYSNQGRQPGKGGVNHAAQVAQQQAQQAAMTQSATPSVTVNANGQLELPYSQEWSAEILQGMGDYNQELAALQGDQQQEGLEYNQSVRNEGINYTNAARTSLNTSAGGGTAFSSAYGVQASNDANAHQNQLNDLLAQQQAQHTAVETQKTALVSAFKDMLRQGALGNADTLAQSAGTLGYGRYKAKKKPGRNTSAHQNAAQHAANQGGNGGRRGGKKK